MPAGNEVTNTTFWNRVQLIAVLVVFAAPIVGAFLYKPTKFNNYGEIYSPVRVITNLTMTDVASQQPIEFDSFRRQWVFLAVANGRCDDRCEFNLLKIRQLRLMQGSDMSRIKSVFVTADLIPAVVKDLADKYQGVDTYVVDQAQLQPWFEQMSRQGSNAESEINRIYIIDPAGNLMMSYPQDADPSMMKKDIKRLLKASQIG